MKFEQAMQAMREGKKVRCPSLSPNTFEFNQFARRFFVDDGSRARNALEKIKERVGENNEENNEENN